MVTHVQQCRNHFLLEEDPLVCLAGVLMLTEDSDLFTKSNVNLVLVIKALKIKRKALTCFFHHLVFSCKSLYEQ